MGQSKSTSTQSLPKFQEEFLKGTAFPMAQQIADQPFQGYGGQFAPELGGMAQDAGGIYGNIAGMGPEQFGAMTQANMNPFNQQVIDTGLVQMNRSADQARTGLEANLIGGGAFGSRGEVARGEFEAGVQGQRDALIANQLQSGYGQAAGMTQQQIGNQMAGAGGLAQLGGMQTGLAGQELAGQYGEFMREQQNPYNQLGGIMQAAGGNYGGTTTQTQQRGLFDYLTAAATAASGTNFSDIRLKENVQFDREVGGVKFYTWDWNDEGKRIADPEQPTYGVIADDLLEIKPEFVQRGSDGYLRVNYAGLMSELNG